MQVKAYPTQFPYERLVGKSFDVFPGVDFTARCQGSECQLEPGMYEIRRLTGSEYVLQRGRQQFRTSAPRLFAFGTFFDCIKGL